MKKLTLKDKNNFWKPKHQIEIEIRELETLFEQAVSLLRTGTLEMKSLKEKRIYDSSVIDFLDQIKENIDEVLK